MNAILLRCHNMKPSLNIVVKDHNITGRLLTSYGINANDAVSIQKDLKQIEDAIVLMKHNIGDLFDPQQQLISGLITDDDKAAVLLEGIKDRHEATYTMITGKDEDTWDYNTIVRYLITHHNEPQPDSLFASRPRPSCTYCGRKGHHISECRKKRRDNQEANNSNQSNNGNNKTSRRVIRCLVTETVMSTSKLTNHLILDSGASRHIIGANLIHLAANHCLIPETSLQVADGKTIRVSFVTNVSIPIIQEEEKINLKLHNALIVPECENSFISVTAMCD